MMDRHDLTQSERDGLTDAEADTLAEQINTGGCALCTRRHISQARNTLCKINLRFPQCRNMDPGFILDETL